jgi:acetyltransferase-like isoleucine patch superfamily enzyme
MNHVPRRAVRVWRLGWTVTSFLILQAVVCGLAALPALALLWGPALRLALLSLAIVPAYVLSALVLMFVSPVLTRLAGWRSPENAEMRIAELCWPALRWARYMASTHLVRVIAGTLFRGSPFWTAYMRLNGARMGRRVYVNSLAVVDHNLLEFGDDVVIGADAHVSGHTVEGGVVRTAPVKLGNNVTVGVRCLIDIGVVVGSNCQLGAMSLVPKHQVLESGGVYIGIPARRKD